MMCLLGQDKTCLVSSIGWHYTCMLHWEGLRVSAADVPQIQALEQAAPFCRHMLRAPSFLVWLAAHLWLCLAKIILLGDDEVQHDCNDAADGKAIAEHQDEGVPAGQAMCPPKCLPPAAVSFTWEGRLMRMRRQSSTQQGQAARVAAHVGHCQPCRGVPGVSPHTPRLSTAPHHCLLQVRHPALAVSSCASQHATPPMRPALP